MIDGTVVCRLVKKKGGLKITKAWTIWCNEHGWCKARSDQGIDKWFKTKSDLLSFIDARKAQRFQIEGELNLPETVVSRYAAYTEDI